MRRPTPSPVSRPARSGNALGILLVRRLLLAPVGGALLVPLLAPVPAFAVEVTFPLTIDYEVLRAALRKHIGQEGGGGALELWRTSDGCGTFVVRDPGLEPVDGRLRIAGPA